MLCDLTQACEVNPDHRVSCWHSSNLPRLIAMAALGVKVEASRPQVVHAEASDCRSNVGTHPKKYPARLSTLTAAGKIACGASDENFVATHLHDGVPERKILYEDPQLGDLHSPRREDSTRLIRIGGRNVEKIHGLAYEARGRPAAPSFA
jgi:hypothetical protein